MVEAPTTRLGPPTFNTQNTPGLLHQVRPPKPALTSHIYWRMWLSRLDLPSMTPQIQGPRGKRATILDVAAAAGVSRQTVTRAMNDMAGISRETRERVQGLAAEMGYIPSRFAKGLVQGARTSVGLAIPDLTNPYFPAFASSVVEAATERGWNVVMDDYGHGTGSAVTAAARLAPQVDALIGYLAPHPDEAQALMGRRPVVAIDYPGTDTAGGISFDYRHAARLALRHLSSRGCRNIIFLDSDQGTNASSRSAAAAAEAEQAGVHLTRLPAEPSAAAAKSAIALLLTGGGARRRHSRLQRPDGSRRTEGAPGNWQVCPGRLSGHRHGRDTTRGAAHP